MTTLRSKNVLIDGQFVQRCITIQGEVIAAIRDYDSPFDIDCGDNAILPGCIDLHVHINEPGRTNWEGFQTGTQSAIAGGTTTIVDMPLNAIPATTDVASLEMKRKAAKLNAFANIGFWGGAVPGNASSISELAGAGVLGFKCFMVPSGVAEFDFVTTEDLEDAAKVIQPTGLRLLAHAEDPDLIDEASKVWSGNNGSSYNDYLQSRPEEAEEEAVKTLVRISKEYDIWVHVVHVASIKALEIIRQAKADGCKITAETCAHYLYFASEEIADGDTLFKCAPPIRNAVVREGLWDGLADGTLDFITTDHSPSLPSLKGLDPNLESYGRFDKAWGGISSLQLLLSVIWTAGKTRGFSLAQVSKWLSQTPADWVGFSKRGTISVGQKADLVIFNPEEGFTVDTDKLFHRHKASPYQGEKLLGVIEHSYVNGQLAFSSENATIVHGPFGKLV